MAMETDPLVLAQVSTWDFIVGFFGTDAKLAWTAQSTDFNGGFAVDVLSTFLDQTTHYVSLASMKPGVKNRRLKNFHGLHMITLDDVGLLSQTTGALMDSEIVKMFAPPETAVVETSHGNYQVSFKIDPPEMDEDRAAMFIEAMKPGQFGPGVQPMSPVHYVRLPSGVNTKPGKNNFPTKLKRWDPSVSYTLDELAVYFGLPPDWSIPTSKISNLGPRETLPNETVIGAMAVIPNTPKTFPDYDDWIRAGNIFKGAAEEPDDYELLEAWVEWSRGMKQAKYDPAIKWETFKPDLTHAGSLRHLVATHAAHPKEGDPDFKERKRRALEADKLKLKPIPPPDAGGFTVVEDGTLPGETPETKAKKEIEDIFERIKKSQPVPPRHAVTDDDNWLDQNKVQTIGARSKAVQIAPPVMIDPHTRNLVTVVAGTPGKGKSLLTLQQAIAVSLDRKDLVRGGLPELNFAGNVVYLSNEDGLAMLTRRAVAFAQKHGLDLAAGPHDLIPLRSTLLGRDGDKVVIECLRILKALAAYGETGKDIAMIVVDTLPASVSGFGENTTDDMKVVMKFLDRLAQAFWCSVVFIHHLKKLPADEDERTLNALRGSGTIGAAVRGAIMVCTPTEKERSEFGWTKDRKIVVEYELKANDGSTGGAFYYELTLEPVQVEHAVTGALTTKLTPVLVHLPATNIASTPAGLRDALDKIKNHGAPVRVVDQLGRGDNTNTVQKVIGCDNAMAKQLVEALEGTGMITIREEKGRNGYPQRIIEIV